MHRDALLLAGHLTCRGCGAVSRASEAMWLDSALLVAYFPKVCEHGLDAMRMVAPQAIAVDPRHEK